MTTRITQVSDHDTETTTLRVEGSIRLADAELLEATYVELRTKHAHRIAIDLADTRFLDSESASILCRLRETGAELIGLHFFVERIIEAAESGE